MRLFETGQDFKVLLNKDWLLTIPPFRKLIHRDKGSPGDYDGRKKLKAIKEFTFIYHCTDPRSPLENLDEDERREKALQYAELEEADIDASVMEAQDEYEYLLENSSPSLPLLRAAKGTNQKLIHHFNTIDFDARDKKGQLVHSAHTHIKNVSMLKQLHDNITAFEKIVLDELKEQKGTRGKTELGDKEQQGSRRKWIEGNAPKLEHDPFEDHKESKEQLKKLNDKAPSFMMFQDFNSKIGEEED